MGVSVFHFVVWFLAAARKDGGFSFHRTFVKTHPKTPKIRVTKSGLEAMP